MVARTMAAKKAKGALLQKMVRDMVLAKFPALTVRDVESTSMGANGVDVKLSQAAFDLFPYAVECKNRASHAVMTDYVQAEEHAKSSGGEPIVVIKVDGRKDPVVVISASHFFTLLGDRP